MKLFHMTVTIVIGSCLLFACVNRPAVGLTPAEATRLADIKARATGHDLSRYDRSQARYDEFEKSWRTSYTRKGKKYVEFNICVDNKTREAWLVLR
jgi:Zn-finger nucleic acid-binding protein